MSIGYIVQLPSGPISGLYRLVNPLEQKIALNIAHETADAAALQHKLNLGIFDSKVTDEISATENDVATLEAGYWRHLDDQKVVDFIKGRLFSIRMHLADLKARKYELMSLTQANLGALRGNINRRQTMLKDLQVELNNDALVAHNNLCAIYYRPITYLLQDIAAAPKWMVVLSDNVTLEESTLDFWPQYLERCTYRFNDNDDKRERLDLDTMLTCTHIFVYLPASTLTATFLREGQKWRQGYIYTPTPLIVLRTYFSARRHLTLPHRGSRLAMTLVTKTV